MNFPFDQVILLVFQAVLSHQLLKTNGYTCKCWKLPCMYDTQTLIGSYTFKLISILFGGHNDTQAMHYRVSNSIYLWVYDLHPLISRLLLSLDQKETVLSIHKCYYTPNRNLLVSTSFCFRIGCAPLQR